MARLTPSLVGGVSGRVGNLVVYNRMGRYFVRRYVEHPRDARSATQLRQRSVFRTMIGLAADMQLLLRRTMRLPAREQSLLASNLFMRMNAGCCTATEDGGAAVDYSALRVSVGPVGAPQGVEASVEGLRLEVRYKRHGQAGSYHDADRVQIYAYCPDLRDGVLSLPAYRYSKKMAFVLPDEMAGHEVHVYAYCSDATDDMVDSPSVYVGAFVPGSSEGEDADAVGMEGVPGLEMGAQGPEDAGNMEKGDWGPDVAALNTEMPGPEGDEAAAADGGGQLALPFF